MSRLRLDHGEFHVFSLCFEKKKHFFFGEHTKTKQELEVCWIVSATGDRRT